MANLLDLINAQRNNTLSDQLRTGPAVANVMQANPMFGRGVADAPTLLGYADNPSPANMAKVIGLGGRMVDEGMQTRPGLTAGAMPSPSSLHTPLSEHAVATVRDALPTLADLLARHVGE